MPSHKTVGEHYTHGTLLDSIRAGVKELGKTESNITLEDLGPVEEFHIGGRIASADFLDQLEPSNADLLLDIGCGLGGVSRFAADRYDCNITGIDLTEEYVQVGREINRWVNLESRVSLEHGSATELKNTEASFDKAYMMHVGMNIADKQLLAQELFRVLKPGGTLGIYDIMRTSEQEITFPVPWASNSAGSALATVSEYKSALESAGFRVLKERNRQEFATSFFKNMQAKTKSAGGLPPLGLHIVMGQDAALKLSNMIENVEKGRIAPTELFAQKPN